MPEFRGYQFDTVLNAVTDLGCDDTGNSDCGSILQNNVSGNDLVVFPDGNYRFDQSALWGSQGGAPIGFVAKAAWDAYSGGDTRDPYIEDNTTYDDIYTSSVNFQPEPSSGHIDAIQVGSGATMDLVIEGITLDHTVTNNADNDSGVLSLSTGIIDAENVDIRNIDHEGRAINYTDRGHDEGPSISAGTESSTGEVVVHGCIMTKLADWSIYSRSARMGFYTGVSHEGTVTYNECEASEVGNNGWYCSGPSYTRGSVIIDNCIARNCAASGFRLSGGNSELRNSKAVVDESIYTGPNPGTTDGLRAIVIETSTASETDETQQQAPGLTISNCTVKMRSAPSAGCAIQGYQTARSIIVKDTEIDIDGVDLSIYSPHPSDGSAEVGWIMRGPYNQAFGSDGPGIDPRHIELDNCTIKVQNEPSSSDATCVVAAVDADDDHTAPSTGTHIHNGTCIETVNGANNIDGVAIQYYDTDYAPFDATIENCTINVSGTTVNNIGGNNITQSNIDTTSSCSFGSSEPSGTGEELYTVDFTEYLQ